MSESRYRFLAIRFALAAILISMLSSPLCSAQDGSKKKPKDDKLPGAPTADTGPSSARQQYDAQLADWKTSLKELRDLRVEYATTTDKDKLIGIEEKWRKAVANIEFALPELTRAAEAAYRDAPNADPQLTTFLGKILEDGFKRDEVEKVFQLGQVLIANDADQKNLLGMTGYAAYCVSEFDKAKEYLEKSLKKGQGSNLEQDVSANLEKVRKNWEEEVEARKKQADEVVTKDKLLPLVQLQTSEGEIVLELFEDEAPETVANFISLVESGFYKDLKFHRVLPHFMVQGGCPKGDGTGSPGYNIYCEVDKPGARKHFRGSLSMAKTAARDTGGSQFFMCMRPTPQLDGVHTVFGRVIRGLEVLAKIERTESDDPEDKEYKPGELSTLFEAKVIRKRDHEYKPKKVQ
jgi:cyclophilin family peptidyl-prolyl cis-trans isomerase